MKGRAFGLSGLALMGYSIHRVSTAAPTAVDAWAVWVFVGIVAVILGVICELH